MNKEHHTSSRLLITALALLGATAASTHAQHSTVWTNGGAWNLSSSWSNGLPTAESDVEMVKTAEGDQGINIPTGQAFKSLSATNQSATATLLRLNLANGTIGGPLHATAINNGRIHVALQHGNAVTVNGPLVLSSSSGSSDSAVLNLEGGTTLTVTGGISFGGNANALPNSSTANAYFTHGDLTQGGLYQGVTINADMTFNNGSRYWVSNNGGANAVLRINGNVTLQAGGYTGTAAEFVVGRTGQTDDGVSVQIRDHLSVSDSATATVRKGKNLETGSATFTAGGRLLLTAWSGASGIATFKTSGDLVVNGGVIQSVASGDSGSYLIKVGGDFILGTGSSIILNNNSTNGLTRMILEGNFNIQAATLASSTTLNNLHLTLEGTAPKTLEAAVRTGNETFRIHSLTFNSETSFITLVDNYVNTGASEFFKTDTLSNVGDTTLDLNGYAFYVGNTQLLEGIYTTYGGTLTVIPEPSSYLLLGSLLAGAITLRRRG